MEINGIFNDNSIVGVISTYKSTLKIEGKVQDLDVKNIDKALIMVGLDSTFLNKDLKDLTISELFKIDLLTKLDKEVIIIGNLSNSLIYKEQEYIKKLLIKLNKDFGKKIVIIDNDVQIFFNICKQIIVLENKVVVYKTDDYFDEKLYEYTKIPKIIEFIKYVKSNNLEIDENIDIYEVIKDIYRRVS